MRKGEVLILGLIGLSIAVLALMRRPVEEADRGVKEIPFYTTADAALREKAGRIYRRNGCKRCHSLWSTRDVMQAVPAPALDGIGSLRDEAWFYRYFSAEDPQSILPSRLKSEYRMPSYAYLTEGERRTLARYMASLKVKDWYLEEVRKAEYEKLTGKEYRP